MNTKNNPRRSAAAAAMLFAMGFQSLSAQGLGMVQGDHEIIVQGAQRIQENFSQMEQANTSQINQAVGIARLVQEHLQKSKNTELSIAERSEHNAAGLENRALLNRMIEKMAAENIAHFDSIVGELAQMQQAADRIDQSDPAYKFILSSLTRATDNLLQKEGQLRKLVAQTEDASLQEHTLAGYNIAARVHNQTIEVSDQFAATFGGSDFAGGLRRMQELLINRQTQLAAMGNVANQNLQVIRHVATNNVVGSTIAELDSMLSKLASIEDPLALEILQPGIDAEFLIINASPSSSLINKQNSQQGGNRALQFPDTEAIFEGRR